MKSFFDQDCLTSKVISITEFLLQTLHQDLTVFDQEHAVTWPVLLDDDIALLVDLMLQVWQDGGDEALVAFPEDRDLSEQPSTHDGQDFLSKRRGREYNIWRKYRERHKGIMQQNIYVCFNVLNGSCYKFIINHDNFEKKKN